MRNPSDRPSGPGKRPWPRQVRAPAALGFRGRMVEMYAIVWEFHVKAGHEREFERFYGPKGGWAAFFAKGKGFVSTELHRDTKQPRRYLTIDRWVAQQDYETFRDQHLEEYKEIDRQCERFTEKETPIGSFHSIE